MRKLEIFAPVAFPFWFVAGFLIAALRLANNVGPFSGKTVTVIALAMQFYILGLVVANIYWARRGNSPQPSPAWEVRTGPFLKIAGVLALVFTAALGYEYIKLGQLPIFAEDVEMVRFEVMQSGYVHLIGMSLKPLAIIIAVFLIVFWARFKAHQRLFLLGLIAVAFMMVLFTGTRGHLILPLAVMFLFYHFWKKNFTIGTVFTSGTMVFLFLSLTKFYREYSYNGESYLASVRRLWTIDALYWLAPGYLTIAMNYQVFNKITWTFPNVIPYQWGRFISYPIISLWPGQQESLGQFQNAIWDTGFYANLTSTYLGIPYADFGVIGVIAVSFIMGLVGQVLYKKMITNKNIVNTLIYSYWAVYLFFSIYTYPFGEFFWFWQIALLAVVPLMVLKKRDAKDLVS